MYSQETDIYELYYKHNYDIHYVSVKMH